MRRLAVLIALVLCLAPAARADDTTGDGLQLVMLTELSQPVDVVSAPGDDRRLFIPLKAAGEVRVIRDGAVLPDPFVVVPGVAGSYYEQGFYSVAFPPDYQQSGRFYVYYADATACDAVGGPPPDMHCDGRVDEFRRDGDNPDRADPASRRRVLAIPHRDDDLHYGGRLAFGPDGYLYLATGDGNYPGDAKCNAQDPGDLQGKVLRIDPRGDDQDEYSIPPDNPFVGVSGARPEVYALGLRNPFRWSFDSRTGDMVVGDVGQGQGTGDDGGREEVTFVAAGAGAGVNFGWNEFEGTKPFSNSCANPPLSNYVAPALEYPNPVDPGTPRAVTGGLVVRSLALPSLLGRYLYGDYFLGDVRSVLVEPSASSDDVSTGLQVIDLVAFAQDGDCTVYVVSLDGPIYRLESTDPAPQPACDHPPPVAPTSGSPATGSPAPGSLATGNPGPVARADSVPPRVGSVRLLRTTFAVARGGTALLAARGTPRGTAFRYTLSESATVTIHMYRALPGRRSGRRCVRPIARLRRARRCTRFVLRGSLVRRNQRAGRRSTPFSGRLGRRPLAPGRYRATLRARDGAGNLSAGRTVGFRVVAP